MAAPEAHHSQDAAHDAQLYRGNSPRVDRDRLPDKDSVDEAVENIAEVVLQQEASVELRWKGALGHGNAPAIPDHEKLEVLAGVARHGKTHGETLALLGKATPMALEAKSSPPQARVGSLAGLAREKALECAEVWAP